MISLVDITDKCLKEFQLEVDHSTHLQPVSEGCDDLRNRLQFYKTYFYKFDANTRMSNEMRGRALELSELKHELFGLFDALDELNIKTKR